MDEHRLKLVSVNTQNTMKRIRNQLVLKSFLEKNPWLKEHRRTGKQTLNLDSDDDGSECDVGELKKRLNEESKG